MCAKNTGIDHAKYGSKCPVCEAQQEIWKQWHDETDDAKKKEIAKQAGSLNIERILYCYVVLNEVRKRMVLSFGVFLFSKTKQMHITRLFF